MNLSRARAGFAGVALLLASACDASAGSPDAGGLRIDADSADAGRLTLDAAVRDASALDAAMQDAAVDASASDAGAEVCPRALAAADRTRYVVIARPFSGGAASDSWEVLALDESGDLSRPGAVFTMGRAPFGEVSFTPDGEVGIVAQDDGTLGVFTLDAGGAPTVVHAAYDGGFYATRTVMDPSGDAVWVLDAEFRNIGGGVYRVLIGCDGTLGEATRVAPAQLPYGMAFLADGRAVLASKDVFDVALNEGHAHLVDLAGAEVQDSTRVFTNDDWIGAGFAVTHDERHVIVGDNSLFSDPHRVGVAALSATSITNVQLLTVIDPVAVVASPFDDAVLVVSGVEDTLLRFTYDPESASPLTAAGPLTYTGANPQLPFGAVSIERGTLEGFVLVAENVAVRRVRFDGGGVITDLGPFALPETVGAIGVQP